MILVGMTAAARASAEEAKIDFATKIKPIFSARCYGCHGAEKQKGKLRLDKRSGVFKSDKDAWVIKPGQPDLSVLFKLISLPADNPELMPANGDPLTQDQIKLIHDWIVQGASWPEDADTPPSLTEGLKIDLPELSAEQMAAVQMALTALRELGALAMPIAANSDAIVVNYSLTKVTDEGLAAMKGLEPRLVTLNLARTEITDAGIDQIKPFKQIRRLHLENTQITDAGLAHLSELTNLEYLNLFGTNVTVSGLQSLKGLKNLRNLFLGETPAAEAGQLPNIKAQKLPGWLKLSVSDDGTLVLTGQPTREDIGDHEVLLEVSDGETTVQQQFKVIVERVNKPPVFVSDPITSAKEGAVYEYAVKISDPDDPLADLLTSLPNLTINRGLHLAMVAKPTCCTKMFALGKLCAHPCCVDAAKEGLLCAKCNPKSQFAKGSCCAKAVIEGKLCVHPCCQEAFKLAMICTKCNPPAN